MERGLIFEERPKFIKDLGSGYSNVYLNVKEIEVETTEEETKETFKQKKWQADVQRVKNPVTYEKVVDSAIREEFPNGAEEAALRKGIVNPKDSDFVKLNIFAESIKDAYKKGHISL